MKIPFTKMEGLGNDFIVLVPARKKISLNRKQVRTLCARHFGVGADQLLFLSSSRKADFKMGIYNQDGSEVEMCGNGLRAIAKYIKLKGLSKKSELKIETKRGIQTVRILSKNKIRVNMGVPILKGKQIPVNLSGRVINRPVKVEGRDFRVTCVSMGNPHAVVFVDNLQDYPVALNGSLLENHSIFPRRTNVEFAKPISKGEIEVRVWERGTGETLACGSGACATAVASTLNGFTGREVTVKLKGGDLFVEWDRKDGNVYMTGPANLVYEGEIDIK